MPDDLFTANTLGVWTGNLLELADYAKTMAIGQTMTVQRVQQLPPPGDRSSFQPGFSIERVNIQRVRDGWVVNTITRPEVPWASTLRQLITD